MWVQGILHPALYEVQMRSAFQPRSVVELSAFTLQQVLWYIWFRKVGICAGQGGMPVNLQQQKKFTSKMQSCVTKTEQQAMRTKRKENPHRVGKSDQDTHVPQQYRNLTLNPNAFNSKLDFTQKILKTTS